MTGPVQTDMPLDGVRPISGIDTDDSVGGGRGMRDKSLIRHPCHLAHLCQRFGAGVLHLLSITAGAEQSDPWAQRQAKFRPFCKVATACGAKWSCDGYGNLKLIETNDTEACVMVTEILELFDIPSWMSPADFLERRAIIVDVLTACVEDGRSLPIRNLIRADEAERAEGRVLSYAEVEDRHEAKYADCAQYGDGTCLLRCPLEHISDRFQEFGDVDHDVTLDRQMTGNNRARPCWWRGSYHRMAAPRHNKSAGWACPSAPRLPQPPSRTRRAAPCPDHARGDFRAVAGSFWRGIMALDDHWIGDVIGALALFASLWIGLVAAWVLS